MHSGHAYLLGRSEVMLTAIGRVSSRSITAPGAWVLVFVVLALIAAIFMRTYGRKGR
jgi:hypothetical protein